MLFIRNIKRYKRKINIAPEKASVKNRCFSRVNVLKLFFFVLFNFHMW